METFLKVAAGVAIGLIIGCGLVMIVMLTVWSAHAVWLDMWAGR